jgi:hypothetical protein
MIVMAYIKEVGDLSRSHIPRDLFNCFRVGESDKDYNGLVLISNIFCSVLIRLRVKLSIFLIIFFSFYCGCGKDIVLSSFSDPLLKLFEFVLEFEFGLLNRILYFLSFLIKIVCDINFTYFILKWWIDFFVIGIKNLL